MFEWVALVLVVLALSSFAARAVWARRRGAVGVGIAAGMVGLAALFGGVDPREPERLEQIQEVGDEDAEDPSGDPP